MLAEKLIVLEKDKISFQASLLYCQSIFSASLLDVSFLSGIYSVNRAEKYLPLNNSAVIETFSLAAARKQTPN